MPKGRPKAKIDKKIFENLCKKFARSGEIASILDVHRTTLYSWAEREYNKPFKEVFEQFTNHAKVSLRAMQFNLAKSNATMAIFLGKQYLGQTDNPISEDSINDSQISNLFNQLDGAIRKQHDATIESKAS